MPRVAEISLQRFFVMAQLKRLRWKFIVEDLRFLLSTKHRTVHHNRDYFGCAVVQHIDDAVVQTRRAQPFDETLRE